MLDAIFLLVGLGLNLSGDVQGKPVEVQPNPIAAGLTYDLGAQVVHVKLGGLLWVRALQMDVVELECHDIPPSVLGMADGKQPPP